MPRRRCTKLPRPLPVDTLLKQLIYC
uniref:Mitochondrial ATP synthase n=1 Tax=Phaeodactylum tricornutum TaxID=2850 RepID=A0A172E706_PHATR|nr:mitochondrial ATP synthase [Phaeodactylum tricornutum]